MRIHTAVYAVAAVVHSRRKVRVASTGIYTVDCSTSSLKLVYAVVVTGQCVSSHASATGNAWNDKHP